MVQIPTPVPDTMPAGETVAMALLLLLHVPGPAPSVSMGVPPKHTAGVPETGGMGLTVTTAMAEQPPAIV